MPIRILLIEDSYQIRENIAELLKLNGYEVQTAGNGPAGVALASRYPPDLILCDIMLPEMDGYGVLENIRNDPALAHVPFIFLTAKADMRDLRRGMVLGADDYLTKPFHIVDLLMAVESRLKRLRQQNGSGPCEREYLRTIRGRDTRGSTLLNADDCYYFFVENRAYFARHPLGTFQVDLTLERLTAVLDPNQFFRINRNVILHRKMVQKYAYWEKGKYCLFLAMGEQAILPRARYSPFKQWLAGGAASRV
ncbi:response regulator [Larkinella soli]|uniref:response regulator n=1 Tax=Larkinella soli TaxID=1770527 RepID=UPI000FFC76C8|nr:response regulator [Larkinella soli]